MRVINKEQGVKPNNLFEAVIYQYSENVSLGMISLLEHNYKHTINSNTKAEVRKDDGVLSVSIAIDLKDYGEFKAKTSIPIIAVKTLEWACDSFISIIGESICHYEGIEAAVSLEKKQECADQMHRLMGDVQGNWVMESISEDVMKEAYKVFCHDAIAELEDLGLSGRMKFHLSFKKIFDYDTESRADGLNNEVMEIAGNRIYLTLHRVLEKGGNIVSVFPFIIPYDEETMKIPFADAMANALESDNELVESLMKMQEPKGDFYRALISFGLFSQEDAEKFTVFDCTWSEVRNIAMFMKNWKEKLKAARPDTEKFCIVNADERLIVVDAKDESLLLKYLGRGYDSPVDDKIYYYDAVNELYSSKNIS